MKFSDMIYVRPDEAELKSEISSLTKKLEDAKSYSEAREVFLQKDKWLRHVMTLSTLVEIRQSINTNDEFYGSEKKFFNALMPELEEHLQNFSNALLESPYRSEFAEEFGELMFLNAQIALKTFSPEIIPLLQEESDVALEYENLLASAAIEFHGKICTLSQLTPYKTDPDDEKRLEAWKAEGQWFKDNREKFDELYDRLVHLRDEMGRKLGYDGYTELGYYRMNRNCYTKDDVEKFRSAVVKYVVPLADGIYKKQAERLNMPYPLSFSDKALEYRSGNPRPAKDAEGILAHAKKFYDELSKETSEFFNMMLNNELMDVLSTKGKASGGYCTSLYDYEVPFIFANFNGTQGDIEVVTHEAGHAFADYLNKDRVPVEYTQATYEACEVHSMSMEFFAWKWAEGFFAGDTKKYLYSHLSGALTFIPYGTAVDHFQHIAYEHPELTGEERHAEWKKLLNLYMPWVRLDGDIPFYGEGMDWQMKHHIYSLPFYYIDYCLAQMVALEFFMLIQKDFSLAWKKYMDYSKNGGSMVFTELLKHAELASPFDENCIKEVCRAAAEWLENTDIRDIE